VAITVEILLRAKHFSCGATIVKLVVRVVRVAVDVALVVAIRAHGGCRVSWVVGRWSCAAELKV
jgi:hypothetical protein